MKNLHKSIFLLIFACFALNSCSQGVSTATANTPTKSVKSASSYVFAVNDRAGGSAFYSMNSQTGAMSYMLDFGEGAGEWINYGNIIDRPMSSNPLLLQVQESTEGPIIYALDGGTGQLYFMRDHGDNAGQWMTYGGKIREHALNMLQFDVVLRGNHSTFYAYDSFTHHTYFMNLSGTDAGRWAKYGTPYQEE